MKLSDFDYHLPEELIAQSPIEPRDHSRLLVLDKDSQKLQDKYFYNLLDELGENDVLVLNKTKVINARLHGYILKGDKKEPDSEKDFTKVEIFLHKQIGEKSWDCLVYPGKKLKPGKEIKFYSKKEKINFGFSEGRLPESQSMIGPISEGTKSNNLFFPVLTAEIKEVSESGRIVEFSKGGFEFLKIIESLGEVPLPPYIKQKLDNPDRYQTVWAEKEGSSAAPTASLHFTPELLERLKQKGVKIEKVLLHVGLGTFMPVKTDNIEEHKMHSEYIEIEKDVAKRLNKHKKDGKRIIAIGTTSIRVLESMSSEDGIISHGSKQTEIFIYPGYKWKFVDSLITNFHLPKSTLLMLVSAMAGEENIKKAYNHAVSQKYRFFSFGDAMWIK